MHQLTPKQRLSSDEGLDWIKGRVGGDPDLSRCGLARELCEHLNWRDRRGRLKEMTCRAQLRALERRGKITLPLRRQAPPGGHPFGALPVLPEFAGCLADLGTIDLRPVNGGSVESRQWRALMDAYHPLGAGPLCGAQIRYLIVSETQGMVGGLSVSAAAWRLSARDEWLGWSDADRASKLPGIVCNSRFLIAPTVKVKHLASHVLGKLARRIGADWQERYGFSPWLMETYVEVSRSGTVYRAANWLEVGLTAGRGRQDSAGEAPLAPKRVFLYPLCPTTLHRLCPGRRSVEPGWLHREFAGAKLGDRRLERRLLELGKAFFAKPMASIPQSCGSIASAKAAYRFFDHDRVTMDALLEPHRAATIDRIRREPVALVVQDTSSLNYTTHPETQGIGPIGTWVKGPQGLILHNTLAFRPDGLPLGVVDVDCTARDPEKFGTKAERKLGPIENKESYKWIKPLDTVRHVADQCPNTKVVVVCDREADIFELFLALEEKKVDFLIRASESRELHRKKQRLWPHMETLTEAGRMVVNVPRHGKQAARTAEMSLRYADVTLAAPKGKEKLPPVRLWAVWSKEISTPPDGAEPLQWMLLTSVPVASAEDAAERVQWYTRRWGIEVFHRVLKSGCLIEDRQLGTADRLEACLAIDMVVAWRIHHLTYLGRATPDVPCTVAFDDHQWKAILVFQTRKPPPTTPPMLKEMILRISKLGGFLGRKSDGEPGTETLWKGLQRMDDIAAAFQSFLVAFPMPPP